jgi:hypothetical protein
MERFLTVAGGQLGPIARHESRQQVVSRLLELMRDAKARGSDIVVFPELALTTFFPRWWMEDEAETDSFSNTKWRVRQLGHCSKPRNYSGSVSISVMPNWRRKTAPRAKRIVYDFRRCFKNELSAYERDSISAYCNRLWPNPTSVHRSSESNCRGSRPSVGLVPRPSVSKTPYKHGLPPPAIAQDNLSRQIAR